MDSFFKPQFNASKCNILLKLSIPRIKLLRIQRQVQLRQMRRDIAKLLETGRQATARIPVEDINHIIREEKMMAAQELIEHFCELVSERLPIIEEQRECPLDLKEAISSICFAAPRCADLPELLQVQMFFAGRHGKEFVSAATELMPDCGVNRQLIELLSIQAPAPPEVPTQPIHLNKGTVSAPEMLPFPASAFSDLDHEEERNTSEFDEHPPDQLRSENIVQKKSSLTEDLSKMSLGPAGAKQFVSFMSPPSQSLESFSTSELHEALPSASTIRVNNLDLQDLIAAAQAAADSAERAAISQLRIKELINKNIEGVSGSILENQFRYSTSEQHESLPSASTINNLDLQDLIAAAQAAADAAELAATAHRSVASLAQLRISELVNMNNEEVSGSTLENPSHDSRSRSDVAEGEGLDK